jgi:mannose-1-phosphate guanylyltransferase
VILAGGDGARLRTFTRAVEGDDRPKQFCRLVGPETLLTATRARLASVVSPLQTLTVVTRHHEPFYADDLADVAKARVIQQPANRGTAVAIATALARVESSAPDAVVGYFPADHHYDQAAVLHRALDRAYAAAYAAPDRVFLIGAEADRPETDYGWIQTGAPLTQHDAAPGRGTTFTVAGFFEKPAAANAAELLAAGCLWNTFVMVGHTLAFRAVLDAARPGLYDTIRRLDPLVGRHDDAWRRAFHTLPRLDFSRDALSRFPERLAVVRLPACGWTDLGNPLRVLDVMATHGWIAPADDAAAS